MCRRHKLRSGDVLVDSCPTARRDRAQWLVLIGPQGAALGVEGTGTASDRVGPLRHCELGRAAVATSLHSHLARPHDLSGETDRHLQRNQR
jgi:hypothetical protein